ncbi:RIC1 protein [Oesophagostomum dentatum]|uniref:Protein RIC1 homolog n=1 Tax=Oesophagostomum dentatum TaxID=61180 RepID=A0A0B1TG68_OESDE|nr:RIC1 protein [Oesophagostomum dentatum]
MVFLKKKLPAANQFQEFPEFLRTVAHCARKTELALWSSLFAVTGSPNDLFEVCLRDGQLHTAASYLIVLQSIESAQTSQEQALRLLREALSAGEWSIAKDMVRFTRAIGSEDMDSPARTPPSSRTSSRRHAASISASVAEADDLVFSRFQAAGRVSKVRHSHADSREMNRKDSTGSNGKRTAARALSSDVAPPSPTQVNPIAEKMNAILDGHATHLLEEYCVRDLGFFMCALDLDIPRVLSSAARKTVQDFPLALTRLHSQFSWPYPVASKKVVDQLEKKFGSMRCSQSAISLNGFFMCALDLDIPRVLSSAARKTVQDFPLALTRMHSQFSWPYPVASKKVVDQLEKKFGSMRCSQSAISLNGAPLNDLARPSRNATPLTTIGLPGKASGGASSSSPSDSATIEDARLVPVRENGNHFDACSTLGSPCSSMTHFLDTPDGRSVNAEDWQGVTLLVGENPSRGSADSLAQMAQLLSWFSSAGCIDWVFLLCVVSRDIVQLRKEISVESVKKVGIDSYRNTMRGCEQLVEWAAQNCLGYVSILHVFAAHLDIVAEAVGVPRKRSMNMTPSSEKTIPNNRAPPLKLGPPPKGGSLRAQRVIANSTKLNETFGLPARRGRERSRSVDRGTDYVVGSTEHDTDSCVIM